MTEYRDQLGNTLAIESPPQRLVCLVPSITELLFELGLGPAVVGITKFCVLPAEAVKQVPKIGGTKNPNLQKIIELQPQLIVASKEENIKEHIELLRKHTLVYVSDVKNLDDNNQMIATLSAITGKQAQGQALIAAIHEAFANLPKSTPQSQRLKAAYLIWKNPYMAAGVDTYIHDMLQRCGFDNYIHEPRYPIVHPEQWQTSPPDVVMLSSEPYPFSKQHLAELQTILPAAKVILVDGQMFSWYGARPRYAPKYFCEILKTI